MLVLSGLQTEDEIEEYRQRIDKIFRRFLTKCGKRHLITSSRLPLYRHHAAARCLFEYLWNNKPNRFGDHFHLSEVVDAQLHPDVLHPVGTCVGLTSLYSVMGTRMGLELSVLLNSAHLLSRLRIGDQVIDIDHTDPQGFDCRNCKDFLEFPLPVLAANVLNSRGLGHERNGHFAAAEADYQQAIRLNPEYANAYNNRGNMRFRDGDLKSAIADYTDAIRLDPCSCEAYCNRGIARQRSGLYEEAKRDYYKALNIDPEYNDAHQCIRTLSSIEQ